MDDKSRRQGMLLAALLIVLSAVLWWNFGTPSGPVSDRRARTARAPAGARAAEPPVETVRLDALRAPRPEPAARGRDPFRFRPEAPPAAPPRGQDAGGPVSPGLDGDGPVQPAGPPPIPLRFIGVMRLPQDGRLIAVLSDAHGVYRGSEGDIIEGRYRIVRLRPEWVELVHLDGRGQQVIRLSGS